MMSPKDTSQQLPLDLSSEPKSAREDLVVSDANRHAVAFLDAWPDWPTAIAIVAGPTGAGKTHLASIWAERSNAVIISNGQTLGTSDGASSFLVEDLAGGAFDQNWLFHVINEARSGGGSVLLTSRLWPGSWGLDLPDLQSRMKLAHLVELNEPDDALLQGVLVKLFADRQMIVDEAVIAYCALRMERSLAFAQRLVAQIDDQSLAQKRAVTVPLARDALKLLGMHDEDATKLS